MKIVKLMNTCIIVLYLRTGTVELCPLAHVQCPHFHRHLDSGRGLFGESEVDVSFWPCQHSRPQPVQVTFSFLYMKDNCENAG